MEKALVRSPNVQMKTERELRGWSQKYMAEQLGADHYYLSRWERGTTSPSPYYRQKLCTLFGKDARALGLLGEQETTEQSHEEVAGEVQAQDPSSPTAEIYDPVIPLLTSDVASLIGREALLQQLKQLLFSGKGGAGIALSGLPGVGKTTLATTLAQDSDVREHFFDGVFWAGLGPTPNVLGLLSRWGNLLAFPAAETARLSTLEDWARALRAAIGTRRILLVIDDAWRIEAALAFKVGGSRCAYLVTTRFPQIALHMAADEATVVSELGEQESLALLAHFAPHVVKNEPEQARALVEAAGGLPLALAIMGRYLRAQAYSRQPRRIRAALERLRDARERLLLTESQAALERSPSLPVETPLSLQTVIEVSDQQLPEQAQRALRALSVFPAKPNSFTEEAAAAIGAVPPLVLDRLADAGLLESSEPGRYTLHQTIADYARTQMEGTEANARLASYFATYAEAHTREYEALEEERNNIFAALQAASERGQQTDLMRCIIAFAPFLQAHGLYSQAETYLRQAEQAARTLQNDTGLVAALLHLGSIFSNRGDYAQAEVLLQEGLSLARKTEGQEWVCQILDWLGDVARRLGDYQQAERYHQEGLALARQRGDFSLVSVLLKALGTDASDQGYYEQAEAYQQEGVALARRTGDRHCLCELLLNCGQIAYLRGDNVLGERYSKEALGLARQIGYRYAVSILLGNLGAVASEQGHYAEAEIYLQEALEMARQIETGDGIGTGLLNLSELSIELGNFSRAEAYLQEAAVVARQTREHALLCAVPSTRGELSLKQQQWSQAEAAFREARDIAAGGNPAYQALSCYGLARAAAGQGNYQEARRLGQECFQLFETMGNRMASQVSAWLQTLPAPDIHEEDQEP